MAMTVGAEAEAFGELGNQDSKLGPLITKWVVPTKPLPPPSAGQGNPGAPRQPAL